MYCGIAEHSTQAELQCVPQDLQVHNKPMVPLLVNHISVHYVGEIQARLATLGLVIVQSLLKLDCELI